MHQACTHTICTKLPAHRICTQAPRQHRQLLEEGGLVFLVVQCVGLQADKTCGCGCGCICDCECVVHVPESRQYMCVYVTMWDTWEHTRHVCVCVCTVCLCVCDCECVVHGPASRQAMVFWSDARPPQRTRYPLAMKPHRLCGERPLHPSASLPIHPHNPPTNQPTPSHQPTNQPTD